MTTTDRPTEKQIALIAEMICSDRVIYGDLGVYDEIAKTMHVNRVVALRSATKANASDTIERLKDDQAFERSERRA